jgi:hypothetical protein
MSVYSTPLATRAVTLGYSAMKYGTILAGPTQIASITIGLASPAELVITDPVGNRTGINPITNTVYDENPNASYFEDFISPDEDDVIPDPSIKYYYASFPLDGVYQVQVIGTDEGSYHLYFLSYDQEGEPNTEFLEGQTNSGQIDTYILEYSPIPETEPDIRKATSIFLSLLFLNR